MTRKDFVLIARALAEARPDGHRPHDPDTAWRLVVANVARALATTNPNFDHARFVRACTEVTR